MASEQIFIRVDNFDREKLSRVGLVDHRHGWGKREMSRHNIDDGA